MVGQFDDRVDFLAGQFEAFAHQIDDNAALGLADGLIHARGFDQQDRGRQMKFIDRVLAGPVRVGFVRAEHLFQAIQHGAGFNRERPRQQP